MICLQTMPYIELKMLRILGKVNQCTKNKFLSTRYFTLLNSLENKSPGITERTEEEKKKDWQKLVSEADTSDFANLIIDEISQYAKVDSPMGDIKETEIAKDKVNQEEKTIGVNQGDTQYSVNRDIVRSASVHEHKPNLPKNDATKELEDQLKGQPVI
ncbi:uncharacterized protein LOC136035334 isoform X2 [Artemia franciscana]|uniref:uncharacterized protein LOC136035334 isoform X2 n=1 Tax=Artemia franciscana TaxID=6661 RepID=UPI0032DB0828